MKKINLTIAIRNLNGEVMKDGNEPVMLNKIIGNLLAQRKAQDALRQWMIAEKIYKSEGEIELEDSDFKLVESAMKESQLSCAVAKIFEEAIKAGKEK